MFQSLNLTDEQVITSHVAARLNGYLNGIGNLKSLLEEIYTWNLNEQQNNAIISIVENPKCVGAACGR